MIGRHHLIGSGLILGALFLITVLGFWYPLQSKNIGNQAVCGTADTYVTHRYQLLFGGKNDKQAYKDSKYAASNIRFLCIRQKQPVLQHHTAKLYLW